MKRRTLTLLCLFMAALLLLATGCGQRSSGVGDTVSATLPPVSNPYAAPTDDSGMRYQTAVSLYLPSRDGQSLLAQTADLTLERGGSNARAIVRALIDARPGSSDRTRAIGGQATLRLNGNNPVEVSGNVCTVNLVGTALALEYDELYTLCLSLAATLSDATEIRYVNLLVEDMAVSFDVYGFLPAGSVVAPRLEEGLPVLWEQMRSRGTPLGGSSFADQQALASTATLYFPLADGSGFVAEARNVTFSGQSPRMLASGLLDALSKGAQVMDGCAEMPDISSLLTLQPEVFEIEGQGRRRIELHFQDDLEEVLSEHGISLANFVASVNWTLSTFIPQVRAVQFFIGTTPLTAISGEPYGAISMQDGMTQRSFFREGLRDQDQIYVLSGDRLTLVNRSIPADTAGHPRTLLSVMLAGVTDEEAALGLSSPLPTRLTIDDILGISVEGDTLLLNLSSNFAFRVTQMSENAQRLCCYAMVDGLCDTLRLTRVRFYWDGEVHGQLGTAFDWSGEFMLNHAVTDRDRRR